MKKSILLSFIFLAVLLSCSLAPKVVIPDEPQYAQIKIYEVDGGICLDSAGIAGLQHNVGLMKAYADKLKAELERIRDGR